MWSCAKCLQPCGTSKEFTVHVFSCHAPKVADLIWSHAKPMSCAYKCIDCAATFLSEKEIKSHLLEAKHSQNFEVIQNLDIHRSYDCFLCGMKFLNAEMCEKHYLHVHMIWVDNNVPVCTETFPSSGDAVIKDDIDSSIVLESIADKKPLLDIGFPTKIGHFCHLCDSVTKRYHLFYLHMQTLHSYVKRFECVVTSCKKTFSSPREFQKHVKMHSQDLKYNCSICDAIFEDEIELRDHTFSMDHVNRYMKMHEKCHPSRIQARNHQCKICQTWFGLRHNLIQHMETDNHDYKCQKCGLQYLQPGSRRLHIQQVHPEIETTCEFCYVKLYSTQAVWDHLKIHGIVHECNICHRRFLHKEEVVTHMEEDHDSPIQCPWKGCVRQLATKINLYYHLKTHRIGEDHKCPYCQKSFIAQKPLEDHMRTHEAGATAKNKKPANDNKIPSESELIHLVCAGCDKGFDDENQFVSHSCTSHSKQDLVSENFPISLTSRQTFEMADSAGELSQEPFSFKEVTWKIPNFLDLPSTVGYNVKSPEFPFADATWCLRLFTNGEKSNSDGYINLQVVRLHARDPVQRPHYRIGFKTRHGKDYETYANECALGVDFEGCGVGRYFLRSKVVAQRQLLVPNGTVTVVCQMRVKKEVTSEASSRNQQHRKEPPQTDLREPSSQTEHPEVDEASANVEKLQSDYSKLLKSEEDSDVCLKVSDKEFRAHRCILRARSKVFSAMFKHETEEKASGEVVIDDLDPESFPGFLQHVYAGRVESLTSKNVYSLYSAADKYDLQDLKSECREQMKRTLSVDTFCEVMTLALRHQEDELLTLAIEFFSKNLTKIILTVKWQKFSKDYNTEANELLIKALVPGGKKESS